MGGERGEKVQGIWRRGSGSGDRGGRSGRRWGGGRHGGSGGRGREPAPACRCQLDRKWRQPLYPQKIWQRSRDACSSSPSPLLSASLSLLLSSSFLLLLIQCSEREKERLLGFSGVCPRELVKSPFSLYRYIDGGRLGERAGGWDLRKCVGLLGFGFLNFELDHGPVHSFKVRWDRVKHEGPVL